jgi:hypothetical protein
MLQHSLDEQLEEYKSRWTPNFMGVAICLTWLTMMIYTAVFLEFSERPYLFAIYFFTLFPVIHCVTRAMHELSKFLRWAFGWLFGWMDNLVEDLSPDEFALPMVFTTTTTCLAIATTILLFKAMMGFAAMLPLAGGGS